MEPENKYYVYRHIRMDKDEPFYIGIGKKPNHFENIKQEYSRAFKMSPSARSIVWNRIAKKIAYNIQVEILFESPDYQEITVKEKEFIALYGRVDLGIGPLVNLTDGGDGTPHHFMRDDVRVKIIKSNTGRKHTEEARRKMHIAQLGNKKWIGKKHSEATKAKLSAIKKGKKANIEGVKKMALTKIGNKYSLGKKRSEEFKRKVGLAQIGNKNRLGIRHTEETKMKMKLSWLKRKDKPIKNESTGRFIKQMK
jgi:hypothetical protein